MPHAIGNPRTTLIDDSCRSRVCRAVIPGVEVKREGRVEPFLRVQPMRSSAAVRWGGIAVEDYSIPACIIPHHEHLENFVHVVLSGNATYEVFTGGKSLRFTAAPGTTFVLPRGTIDELHWHGPTHRVAVAVHPSLLIGALDETAGERDVELSEHWNATDRHIMAVLIAMTTDLEEGSPAGRLYGESLANALAVYLLNRYSVQRYVPAMYRRGLPGYRLKRVLDYIAVNLAEDLSLSELAAQAGLSPHYFAELFRQSMGCAPHRYVLLQRIERSKQTLGDPRRTVLEACVESGFQNPTHFARMFRRFVGVTPSRFKFDRTA